MSDIKLTELTGLIPSRRFCAVYQPFTTTGFWLDMTPPTMRPSISLPLSLP